MRYVLAFLLGGYLAGSLDANSRPAVIPKLSELPEDHAQRDAVLGQSHETAGPEQRKGMTKKERKAETAAALAAAIIGDAFSSDHNVTIGAAIDSSADDPKPIPREDAQGSGSGAARPAAIEPAGELLPWVKLK
jgi:hypothetical protein